MTRRRWIADTWDEASAALHGDQAQHLSRVLRAQPGMEFDVIAGGRAWLARIASIDRDSVRFTLLNELEAAPALPVTLLLSIFKFDRMEWAIEKATELGISRITPILARRTEKHLAHAALKRSDRWRRIALEASKQSRRTTIPEIPNPIALKPALEHETTPTRILLSETEQQTTLSAALQASVTTAASEAARQSTAIAIGPEGGWTPEEISLFTQHQWQPVTLGPRILRAETAAIAAIAIASTHLA
jgi:16S rRNA (uracil1498-N3)-methyltransferase